MGRARRTIFVGNLPCGVRESEIRDLFDQYGPIVKLDLRVLRRPQWHAFVQFKHAPDVDDAIRGRNGHDFGGCLLQVERFCETKASSSRRYGGRVFSDYRVLVTGLPFSATWQDLKNHMRRAGNVGFAQVFRLRDGMRGVVDFKNYNDMRNAIRRLNGSLFDNRISRAYITVEESNPRRSRSPHSRGKAIDRKRSSSDSSPSMKIPDRARPRSPPRAFPSTSALRSPSKTPDATPPLGSGDESESGPVLNLDYFDYDLNLERWEPTKSD